MRFQIDVNQNNNILTNDFVNHGKMIVLQDEFINDDDVLLLSHTCHQKLIQSMKEIFSK